MIELDNKYSFVSNTWEYYNRLTIDRCYPRRQKYLDVARRANIAIPAACYRAKKEKGCCHGCVVKIDGEQKFACVTVPKNGMNVFVSRDDLKVIRMKKSLEI